MGSRLTRLEFTPGENEQIELVVKMAEEPRSIIHGIVKDHCDKIIENAVVKLFEIENPCNPCSLKPITHTFTDECGQFLFGPLSPCKHYVIKVWVSDVKIRHMIIKQSDEPCECEIEKDEDKLIEERDVVITNERTPEDIETRTPGRPVNQQSNKNRPIVRRPRQT